MGVIFGSLSVLLSANLSVTALGQSSSSSANAIVSSAPVQSNEILRVIDDPGTHERWLVVADPQHPGGPARLVKSSEYEREVGAQGAAPVKVQSAVKAHIEARKPVIRPGELLIVEEHSQFIDMRLEAVALSQAVVGDTFDVRLKVGGKVVRAVATAPGHARLAAQTGVRP